MDEVTGMYVLVLCSLRLNSFRVIYKELKQRSDVTIIKKLFYIETKALV